MPDDRNRSPSRSRSAQKEATRARLLEVARERFEASGFEATTLRDVARAAGVAVGTVFVHFGDKTDLLHAALFEDLEAVVARALAELPEAPLEAATHHVAAAFLGLYQARPKLSRTLLGQSLFAEPPWRARFTDQVTRVHAGLVARFEAARARGEVAADASAELFGVAFLSFYYFALISWLQEAHPDPLALVDHLVAQHLRGVRPPEKERRCAPLLLAAPARQAAPRPVSAAPEGARKRSTDDE